MPDPAGPEVPRLDPKPHWATAARKLVAGTRLIRTGDAVHLLEMALAERDAVSAEVPPLERLLALATEAATRQHDRAVTLGFGDTANHRREFTTCPHPDCALIRAEGEARRRVPPDQQLIEAVRWAIRFLRSVEWNDATSEYEAANVRQALDDALEVGHDDRAGKASPPLPVAPLVRSSAPDTCTGQVHHGDAGATRCHCGAVSIREITFLHPGVRSGDGA